MEQQKLTNIKDTIAFLSEKFPECFIIDGEVKPIKIGIFQDLTEALGDSELLSKRLLRMSLRHYTSAWKYLAAVKEDAHRVDLDGKPGDKVEAEHAAHAAEQLLASKKLVAERREKQRAENRAKQKLNGQASSDKKHTAQKQHKPASSAHKADKSKKSYSSVKSNRQNNQSSNKPIKLKVAPIEENALSAGLKVSVKVGQQPMPATVTEVLKDGVFVQLNSGMTVKVQPQQLRLLVD